MRRSPFEVLIPMPALKAVLPAAALVPERRVHGEIHGHAVRAVAGEEAVVGHAVPDVPLGPLDGVGAEERHLREEEQVVVRRRRRRQAVPKGA